jgi:DNA-directed RNA polymerase specialized sigma24 family protein
MRPTPRTWSSRPASERARDTRALTERYLRAWLSRTLTNALSNDRRSRKVRAEVLGLDGLEAGEPIGRHGDQAEIVLAGIPGKAQASALRSVRPVHPGTVPLAGIEGYSYKEIAALCGMPVRTVMSTLHRGRQALQKDLFEHRERSRQQLE